MRKCQEPYGDVGLVDVVFPSFLGNEEHPLEEEESSGVLRPQHMKGALQHQLSVGGQVRTLPVDEERLDLLQMHMKAHSTTRLPSLSAMFLQHERR